MNNDQQHDGIVDERDDLSRDASDILADRAHWGQLVKLIDETVDVRLPETVEGKLSYASAGIRHAENSLLAAGLALIYVRKEVPYGQYLMELKKYNIHERTARRCVLAASAILRMPDRARERALAWPQQKLLVLGVLSDKQLAEIDEKAGPCGLSIAEIELKPAKELQRIIEREKRRWKHAEDEKARLIEENHHLQEELATARGQAPSRDDAASIEVQRLRESQAHLEQLLDALRPDRFTDAGTAIQRRAREIVVFARMRVATIEADWNELRGEDTSVYLVPVSDQLPDARIAAVQQHEKVRALLETGAPESIIERPRRVK